MKRLLIAGLLLGLLPATPALAEQSQKFGGYEVHYNAMPTSDLAAEVAKVYKIERSQTRGLLTISVLKSNPLGGMGTPVKAKLTATAVTLPGQLLKIDMKEIQEGSAVYYIGQFRVAPPDTLKFTVEAVPQGTSNTLKTEFSQQFFK